jgi:glycyl-tRNA synthetase
MFGTNFGSTNDIESKIWLRPETAQGIFVNFLNVQKSSRLKIPFGIAQIGKAFRNEIIARQFIFRMREFEQMEMQFFVQPGKEIKWFNKWKENRINWHYKLGIEKEKLRFHDHEKLAHYANAACDIEYDFPFGYKEIEGIHSRTNFDLESHSRVSGKKIKYFDSKLNKSFTPFVIETSIGLDRMFLLIMCNSIKEETLKDGEKRIYLKFPFNLSPVKLAILPLTKKNGLPIIARKIYDDLKIRYHCVIEEKDSIGKRYRRQDAIGTPFCITIDNESPHDNKVTIRNRDDMTQDRIYINSINNYINDKLIY